MLKPSDHLHFLSVLKPLEQKELVRALASLPRYEIRNGFGRDWTAFIASAKILVLLIDTQIKIELFWQTMALKDVF